MVRNLAVWPLLARHEAHALEDALARVSALVEAHPEVSALRLEATGVRVCVEPREPELPAGTLARTP
jgi:hypothetical protein